MGNIVGDPLNENVKKQINIRQSKLGKINRDNEDLLFYNSKTAWLRLASSINVDETADIFKSVPNLTNKGNDGSELAKKCVLFGGMSSFNNDNNGTNNLRFGINRINTDPTDILGVGAYGFGGSLDKYGFSPMPGLVGANVSFYNRGALKKATIQLKVFNPIQLQIIDTLYLRIGYTMLLEWGWSLYFNKDGKLEPSNYKTEPFELLFDKTKITQNTEKSTQNTKNDSYQNLLLESIKKERETRSYNYDAMFGKVSNFNWKFNDDGSYDIEITLIGLGDVVEALKTNISTGTGKVNDLVGRVREKRDKLTKQEESATASENRLITEFNNLVNQEILVIDKFNFINESNLRYDSFSGEKGLFGIGKEIFNVKGSKLSDSKLFDSYLQAQTNGNLSINTLFGGYSKDTEKDIEYILYYLDEFSRIKLWEVSGQDGTAQDGDYTNSGVINVLFNNYFNKDYNYIDAFKLSSYNVDRNISGEPTDDEKTYIDNVKNIVGEFQKFTFNNVFTQNDRFVPVYTSPSDQNLNIINSIITGTSLTVIDKTKTNKIFNQYIKEFDKILKTQESNNNLQFGGGYRIGYPEVPTFILSKDFGEWLIKLNNLFKQIKNQQNTELSIQKQLDDIDQELERAEIIGGQSYIKYANTTLMNKFLYYNIYEPLSKKNQSKPFPLETNKNSVLSPDDIKVINDLYPKSIIKYNFKTKGNLNKSIDYSQYYIKLGALLKVVERKLLLYNSEGPSGETKISKDGDPKSSVKADPLFTFDIDKDTYCLSYSKQKSADPLVCIIPYKNNDLKINFLSNDKFRVNDNVGKPLEIYININHIANCVLNNLDKDGGVNLLSFLRALLSGVNDALGNINKLDAIYDNETNKVKILEESNLDNPDNKSTLTEKDSSEDFRIYGVDKGNLKGSFITNVDFTVTLPPNMAAMATISAQASGIIVGEGATALSNLNNGLKDRVIPEKSDAQSISKLQDIKGKIKDDIVKQIKENKNINNNDFSKYINGYIKNNKIDPNTINTDSLIALLRSDPDIILAQQIKAVLQYTQEIYGNFIITQENIDSFKTANRDIALHNISANSLNIPGVKQSIPAPFFIPFNLSLTMDGLAGMVNYQRFTITKDILPYQYSANKIDFIIKGITHDIKDNYWTTQIESISVGAKTNRSKTK